MSEDIRLVVWDLDETFWRGTLSEEGIEEYSAANHDIVVSLARRGIVSSICSKNDHERVKQVLVAKGLWDYFIFPSIDWTPKAPRLGGIIEDVQLRPESVLFIDDNPSNRGEASVLIPGLMVSDEKIIPSLLGDQRCRGKSDPDLDRLNAYKVLESKALDRSHYESDVRGFIRASEITVTIGYEIEDHIDRIVEILNRTNQLNFTKRRLAKDQAEAKTELRDQLDTSFARRAGTVQVSDKYGDYGLVGFWAVEGYGTELRLLHFAFSCRILGMGVEQWVYDKLGAPALDVVGTVVSTLDFVPDWINTSAAPGRQRQTSTYRSVYLRGACELEILRHFFSFASEKVEGEFVFMRGILTVWRSHIVSMFPQDAMQGPEARDAVERLGFELDDFGSPISSRGHSELTLAVISSSADATVPLYKHKRHGFLVPIHEHGLGNLIALSADEIDVYVNRWNLDEKARGDLHSLSAELKRDYRFIGPGQMDFGPYYARLAAAVPARTLIIFLLPTPDEGSRRDAAQHKLNDTIRALAVGSPNVRCVEVADHIKSTKKIVDPSRFHLDREVYHSIYRDIASLHAKWVSGESVDDRKSGSRSSSQSMLRYIWRRIWAYRSGPGRRARNASGLDEG